MKYCPICNAKYEDSVSFCATDGEVLEEDVTSLVDSTLDGQYHIEAMLGKGGMGAVYRARHILLGDRVAIKVLPPQMRNNAEWLRRFRREGQAARRFRHPNSVQVYDLRTTPDGMTYMVMEYVEGRTLDAELKDKGRFTPREAFETLEPITSVLNAAHAQGVVHRDLKPENIMMGKPVDGQPVVKLLDLGIAKISDIAGGSGQASPGTTALTVAGQILGTPYYMSPEQWGEVQRDRKEEIDGRADIYSLGAVFYELVAGRKPFMGLTLAELRGQHVKAMPQPLHEFMTDVPQGFSLAIQRALSKDRGDRQATAGEFANELRGSLGMPQLSTTGSSLSTSSPDAQNVSQTGAATAPPPASAPTTMGQPPEARQTGTDVAAPTMVTMDAPPRPPDQGAAPWANQPPQSYTGQQSQPPSSSTSPVVGSSTANDASQGAPPMPTMMTGGGTAPPVYGQSGASYASSGPAQTPSYTPAPSQAQPKGRSLVLPIVGGVLVLLLLVGGVGAFFIYKSMSAGGSTDNKDGTDKPVVTDTGDKKTDDTSKPAVATVEAVRYALEVEKTKGGERARVAGTVPLASGQTFKFHFTSKEDGYLYIVGPGPGNVPMTFLTAKPVKQSGVKNNEAQADTDYEFPYGDGNWITLDQNEGTEDYTVIFSTEPLETPAFLSQLAGKTLTEEEQSEFFNFVGQYKANAPTVDVSQGEAADPFVSIKVPEGRKAGEPIIFTVRIEHK
ncbi:MAG TPA: protein kinase [Pyrinomonadaceae bacterium]|nr:protein kinase [Pyrinomonadaceae bacterium]